MTNIACAAFIRNGEVLFARRAPHKKRFPNQWDLVGGHVEVGESVSAALVREAQEEVGLTPTEFHLLAIVSEHDEEGGNKTRYRVHAVTEWSGGSPQLLGDEHTETKWVAIELLDYCSPVAHAQFMPILARMDGVP